MKPLWILIMDVEGVSICKESALACKIQPLNPLKRPEYLSHSWQESNDSAVLCWALAAFSVSWCYTQSVRFLGRGISPSQGFYLHIEQHKHRINADNTDIHGLSGIRTHDPSVRASEDSSYLRPRGHCDWHYAIIQFLILRSGTGKLLHGTCSTIQTTTDLPLRSSC
jgi:hypothetical protein